MISARWRPWLYVIIGILLLTLSAGTRQSFGLFLRPISGALGFGREVFALSLAVQGLILGLCTPFTGMIADKFGVTRVLIGGALLYALGMYGLAFAVTPLSFHLSAGLLIGLGLAASSNVIIMGAVARSVSDNRRSQALGALISGGAMGRLVVMPLAQVLIAGYGWQTAVGALGTLLLLSVPLAFTFRASRGTSGSGAVGQSLADALREAAAHRGYRLLTAGFFVCGFHVSFIGVHLPAFVVDQGFSPAAGATALWLIFLFNIFGAYTWGHLGGLFPKKRLLSTIYLSRAALFTGFLLVPPTQAAIYAFAGLIGFLWLGTVPLTNGLVGQIFGLRYLSTLYGIVFMSHQFGNFMGSWLGGYVFDLTGSYDLMWYLSIALGLASAALHWPIDDRAVKRPEPAGQPA